MKTMTNRYIITIIVTMALAITAAAQEPASDAVYRNLVKEYTLNADGSWTYHYSHNLVINTYFAFHNLYGEDFIVYNPQSQKLKINKSVTTTPAGKVVPSPANAYNELLPGSCANAPAYNHLREMVVTHTALERGSVIDFDYTLTSTKDYWPAMAANDLLSMNSPVDKLTYTITIPAGTMLNYKIYNITQEPVVTKTGSKTKYTWTIDNIPAALREDFRPKEQQNRPRIVFSTSKSYTEAFTAFASQPAFALNATEPVKATAQKVRDEKKGDLAVALRLQEIVANDINTYPVAIAQCGLKVREAAQTWQENGGTEAEKAVLLAALLKTAGIDAEPVAVIPACLADDKTVSLLTIEKFLVEAKMGKKESVLLSPLQVDAYDETYTLPGKKIVPLANSKVINTRIVKEYTPAISVTGTLSFDQETKLSGNVDLVLAGRLNPYFSLSADSLRVKKLLTGAFSEKSVDKYTIGNQGTEKATATFTLQSKEPLKETSGLYFFEIPTISSGTEAWHMTELVSQRTEPLEIPFLVNESYNYVLSLPSNMELISKEVSVEMKKDFGELKITIRKNGDKVDVSKSIRMTQALIEPAQYEAFRNFINTWNSRKYSEIILQKK